MARWKGSINGAVMAENLGLGKAVRKGNSHWTRGGAKP